MQWLRKELFWAKNIKNYPLMNKSRHSSYFRQKNKTDEPSEGLMSKNQGIHPEEKKIHVSPDVVLLQNCRRASLP